ncbi:MAG: hypothetical protein ATN33_04695 [Epulopiscium sp. Nele67-Bin001]|nr:MAG: hypothetical protein BEN18_02670 [Epulopiscium sp. Nuni2H_MBin001]OON94224.1 MAG: hypothetical protein ATN33_04695 [Epulopiscium sp. Nele67-Bin001]
MINISEDLQFVRKLFADYKRLNDINPVILELCYLREKYNSLQLKYFEHKEDYIPQVKKASEVYIDTLYLSNGLEDYEEFMVFTYEGLRIYEFMGIPQSHKDIIMANLLIFAIDRVVMDVALNNSDYSSVEDLTVQYIASLISATAMHMFLFINTAQHGEWLAASVEEILRRSRSMLLLYFRYIEIEDEEIQVLSNDEIVRWFVDEELQEEDYYLKEINKYPRVRLGEAHRQFINLARMHISIMLIEGTSDDEYITFSKLIPNTALTYAHCEAFKKAHITPAV